MDITQLIMDDHTEQRRLFALIDELAPGRHALPREPYGRRLRVLLDTHALAEERFFYPELLKVGRGADHEDPERRDARRDQGP